MNARRSACSPWITLFSGLFSAGIALAGRSAAHASLDAAQSSVVQVPEGVHLSATSSDPTLDAQESQDWKKRFYFDASASWGIANSALPSANGGTTLSQVGLGGSLGWKLDRLLWIGLSSDFRSAGLSADLLSAVSEVEGARLNLASPTIGLMWGESLIKAEVALFGDYRFSTTGALPTSYTLRSPRGLRMTFLHPMVEHLHAGIQGEVTSWGERALADGGASERLLQREVLWQASLTAAWVF